MVLGRKEVSRRKKKKWSNEEKQVLKTIKVKESTYIELVKMISMLQLERGAIVHFDEVISYLISLVPESEIQITEIGGDNQSS